MNKITISLISVVLVVAIGGGAYFLLNGTNNDQAQSVLPEIQPETEQSTVQDSQPQDPQPTDPASAVATVNGEEITLAAFEMQMQQMGQNPQLMGAEAEELQNLVLDQLIHHTLLIQAARDQDITVEEDVIEAEFDNVASQFESREMLATQLEMIGMDEASLRDEIEDQAVLNEYYTQIVQENDIEVTDEEIETFYDEQVAIQEGAPSLEEVRPLISDQLEQQKIQPYLAAVVEEYLESADIQIRL